MLDISMSSKNNPQSGMAKDSDSDTGNLNTESEHSNETDSEEEKNLEADNEVSGDEFLESNNDNTSLNKSNAGWADAMKKILNAKRPKRKKSIVLSKAKKITDIITKEKNAADDKESKDSEVKKEIDIEIKNSSNERQKQKRRDCSLSIRLKPSVLDREKEKYLQKIATKGVVQLFNAVRQQQLDIDKKLIEAGPLERKREKVYKNIDKKSFLDVLMGGTKSVELEKDLENETKDEKKENDEVDNKVWSILRDDFVMGAKLKDWNRKNTDSESSSEVEEIESA